MGVLPPRPSRTPPKPNCWRDKAIRYTTPLEPRKHDRDVHDLGFIFLSTYYRWYSLTKDPALNEVLIEAGQTLAMRFKESGQYLRSFVAEDSLFIDIMMNVGIIFYAAPATGDKRLREIAMRHSLHDAPVCWCAATVRPRTKVCSIWIRASSSARARNRASGAIPAGRAGLPGRSTASPAAIEYSRDPHFLQRLRPAPITISLTPAATAFRRGISTLRRKLARSRTPPPLPSRRPAFPSVPVRPIRMKGHFYWSAANRILRSLCDKYLARNDAQVGRDSQGRRVSPP